MRLRLDHLAELTDSNGDTKLRRRHEGKTSIRRIRFVGRLQCWHRAERGRWRSEGTPGENALNDHAALSPGVPSLLHPTPAIAGVPARVLLRVVFGTSNLRVEPVISVGSPNPVRESSEDASGPRELLENRTGAGQRPAPPAAKSAPRDARGCSTPAAPPPRARSGPQ